MDVDEGLSGHPWNLYNILMSQKMAEEIFLQFQNFLVEESGIYVHYDRSQHLVEKIEERMNICQVKSYEHYFQYLRFNPRGRIELKALLDAITIGETYFFRNEPHFEVLETYVIPKIIAENSTRNLKIWCAGCSTGEEAYSIAMFLRKVLPDFSSWNVRILATDINRQALKTAQAGIYGSRSVGLVPPDLLNQYFTRKGRKYWISPTIKNDVHFEYHNLARDAYALDGMRELDILFCRNVTIYFDLETLKRVIAQFADCVRCGGVFFIGHAETLWRITEAFCPIEFPKTFIYQKSEGLASGAPIRPHIPLPTLELKDLGQQADLVQRNEKASEEQLPVETYPTHSRHNQGLKDHFTDLMKQANELANHQEYEKAIQCIQEIISEDNLYVPAYYFIAVLREKMEQYDQAIEEFGRVLYIDETLSIAYWHLGNLYCLLDRPHKAKKEYMTCLKMLENGQEDDPVMLSEGMTVGVLYQAVQRALASL